MSITHDCLLREVVGIVKEGPRQIPSCSVVELPFVTHYSLELLLRDRAPDRKTVNTASRLRTSVLYIWAALSASLIHRDNEEGVIILLLQSSFFLKQYYDGLIFLLHCRIHSSLLSHKVWCDYYVCSNFLFFVRVSDFWNEQWRPHLGWLLSWQLFSTSSLEQWKNGRRQIEKQSPWLYMGRLEFQKLCQQLKMIIIANFARNAAWLPSCFRKFSTNRSVMPNPLSAVCLQNGKSRSLVYYYGREDSQCIFKKLIVYK